MPNKESKEVQMTKVLTPTQRVSLNRFFNKYKIAATKKSIIVKRADKVNFSRTCNFITINVINKIIEKCEEQYEKTKNMNTKYSIYALREMRKNIETFLTRNKI